MAKTTFDIKLRELYFISFIEGGVVMVAEIAGAKLLTPFFGASLYSWASTLSITLLALMTGYYSGGYATTKHRLSSPDKIIWIFFLSGLAVLIMPSLGYFIMQKTLSFPFFSGLIISELLFLFIPIFLMGMISPMIIYQITKKAEESGRSAGNIYAISTSGGILFTLFFGFLVIPNYGISLPVKLLGLCVSLIAVIFLLKEKLVPKKVSLVLLCVLFIVTSFSYQNKSKQFAPHLKKRMVDYSEGLLGELKVVDELYYDEMRKPVNVRKLKTNNVQQNYVLSDSPNQSLMYYVNFTKQILPFLPEKQSALLIGLGAGSLYTIMKDQKMDVESVEIDQRICDIGVNYFGMAAHQNNHITDGRYFINVTNKKYDVIVLDVIIGESVPAQLVTLESFRKIYTLLNKGGTLIVEHGGIPDLQGNSFIPSVLKTLNAAGFSTHIFNPLLSKKFGDVLLVATKDPFDISRIRISDDVCLKAGLASDYELFMNNFNTASSSIITDDKNNIDAMLKAHYLEIRKGIRKELIKLGSF